MQAAGPFQEKALQKDGVYIPEPWCRLCFQFMVFSPNHIDIKNLA
jgi:hypothetical protein